MKREPRFGGWSAQRYTTTTGGASNKSKHIKLILKAEAELD